MDDYDLEEHLEEKHGWDERDVAKYQRDELEKYHDGEHLLNEFPFGERHQHEVSS